MKTNQKVHTHCLDSLKCMHLTEKKMKEMICANSNACEHQKKHYRTIISFETQTIIAKDTKRFWKEEEMQREKHQFTYFIREKK